MQKAELAELTLVLFHETEAAYLVGETEDRDKAVWLPKSKSERERKIGDIQMGRRTYEMYEFTLEQWLALRWLPCWE